MVVEKIAIKRDWAFLFLPTDFGVNTWCYIADDRELGLFKVVFSVFPLPSGGTSPVFFLSLPRDNLVGGIQSADPEVEDLVAVQVFGQVSPPNQTVTFLCYGVCMASELVGDGRNISHKTVYLLKVDIDTFTGGYALYSPFLSYQNFSLRLYTRVADIPSDVVGGIERDIMDGLRNQQNIQNAYVHPKDLKVVVSDFGEAVWLHTVEENVQDDVIRVRIEAALHGNVLNWEALPWEPVLTYYELEGEKLPEWIVHFAVDPSQSSVNIFVYKPSFPPRWELIKQIPLPLGLSVG